MKIWHALLALLALLAPATAMAADNVSLTSKVFVERVKAGADGKSVTVREEPGVVDSGRPARLRAQLPQFGRRSRRPASP